MQNRRIDKRSIVGWGIDADPRNDPTYPIKQRNNAEHAGYSWPRPTQQRAMVEVLHSNERPNLSATFGTSTPPRNLSGMLRRFAFRFSESNYGHWLPLMLADRVGVFEGIFGDVTRGRLPNLFLERGGRAEWQFNRGPLVRRLVIRLAVLVAVVALIVYFSTRNDR